MKFTRTVLADPFKSRAQPETWWYPKVTPYRILVLFFTIGLGSAKAYAVSRDLYLAAVYIEWLIGVVVFSMLSPMSNIYSTTLTYSSDSSFLGYMSQTSTILTFSDGYLQLTLYTYLLEFSYGIHPNVTATN